MKRGKLKKLFCMLLALSMVLVCFAGCGSGDTTPADDAGTPADDTAEPATSGDLKIGVSFSSLEQERMVREKEMFEKMAAEDGIELIVQSADYDSNKQQSQCENMFAAGIQALLLYPVDSAACVKIVDAAHSSDIPVIAYDNLVMDCDLDYYVSFDSIAVGEKCAEYMMNLKPTGNYLLLEGEPSYNNAQLVMTGFWNVIQDAVDKGDINIVAEQWCDGWGSEPAMQHTENALTASDNQIDVILSAYDGMTTGAVSALDAQGLAGKVLTTGQDAELSACQRIVEGTQTMTIYKPISELAEKAYELAARLCRGEDVSDMINGKINNNTKDVDSVMPDIYVVDKDNMKEMIIDSGFHTLEEVYANVPQDQWPQ